MAEFKHGDIVRVTIEGRVVSVMPKTDQIAIDHDHVQGLLVVDTSHLPVERTAPAEWPPQVDDLWRGADGVVWFVMQGHADSVLMTDRTGGRHGPEYVIGHRGPLTFVHREQQDGGAE